MTASRLWKFVEIATGTIGVALAISSGQLGLHYAFTRPRIPDPTFGRVYSLNTHGSIVYLTGHEQTLMNSLLVIGGALFVIAVAVDIIKKPFRSGSTGRT